MDIHMRTPSPKIQYPMKRTNSGLSSKMSKIFVTPTPKRMTKRSKVPAPLHLSPLTPPQTVKKNRNDQLDSPADFLNNLSYDLIEDDIESPLFHHSTITTSKGQKKSIIHEKCSICEELITTKLSGEKTIQLDCNHQCHFNCYLLLLDNNNLDLLPMCTICLKPVRPMEEELLEELYSKSLIQDLETPNVSITPREFTPTITQSFQLLGSPIDEFGLPEIPSSGFKPNFPLKYTSTPYTPQGQFIDNSNDNGFQINNKASKTYTKSSLSSSSVSRKPSYLAGISNDKPILMSQYSADDLTKPNVDIIPEFNKHVIDDNISKYSIGSLVNIFTNDLTETDMVQSKSEDNLKEKIHKYIVDLLIKEIEDSEELNFKELQPLQIFDFIEISLDEENWESVHAFIFKGILILINEEFDLIIGTIQIARHFTKIVKLNDSLLQLYFSSTELPELQLRSSNKILITKWDDYFQHKIKKDDYVSPLIQMTTNLWDIITLSNDSKIEIPSEIIKFNDLTSKGLDLPFQMMRKLLPKPKPLKLNVVLTLQLYNYTTLSNSAYLHQLKLAVLEVLKSLDDNDRMGLIFIGRDGSRLPNLKKNTFVGMVNSKWGGWSELLEELAVFDGSNYESSINKTANFKKTINSLNTLLSTIPDLSSASSINKVIMINNGWAQKDGYDDLQLNDLKSLIRDYDFSLHHVVINAVFDQFNEDLIEKSQHLERSKSYHFERFDSYDTFITALSNWISDFKRVRIPKVKLTFEIADKRFARFQIQKFDQLFDDNDSQKFEIQLKDLYDGYYKSMMTDVEINVPSFIQSLQVIPQSGEFIEVPIFKLTYEYLNKSITRRYTTKISLNRISENPKVETSSDKSSKDQKQASPSENINKIDIPMALPPLSSFKDSIFVKRRLEILIVTVLSGLVKSKNSKSEELASKPMQIKELITLIFGMIRGCSTNHMEFYKHSKFRKYKNFTNYVNELIKRLNQVEGNETLMKDMIYKLLLEEAI